MPGEAVLEHLEAVVGGREVARGCTRFAFELAYTRSGASGRCSR